MRRVRNFNARVSRVKFPSYRAQGVTVVVNVTNIREFESESQVQNISPRNLKIHPGWSETTLRNDVCLIKTTTSIRMGKHVLPINLPRFKDVSRSFEGETGIAAGWGQVRDAEPELSEHLRWVDSDIETNSKCSSYFPGLVTGNHVCASGANGRSICNGDNGGPVIINDGGDFKQVGIASFVYETCETGAPGVFTRLTPYLDWIQDNSDVIIRS